MRSFTSTNGDVIEVTKEHLDTAVRIKKELQNSSPSHKCNWKQLVSMMELEGYEEAEANESYRQMIKHHQKSIGELPSQYQYADMVTTSKLQSIKEAVGEMFYAKRELQLESNKLNRLKRNLSLHGIIAEEVKIAMTRDLNEKVPCFFYERRLPSGKKKMIVTLSDLHIGAVINDVMGNSYNYEIAKKRMKLFFDKVTEQATMLNITDIDVVLLGDATEHVQMRKTQSFDAEFPLAVQIVKAYEIIRDFVVNLTRSFNVTYRGISGNHDRMEGKKEDNIDGDSTIYVINYMMKEFAERENSDRLVYVEADNILYSTVIEANNVKIKFVHGDNEGGKSILAKHEHMDGEIYNAIVMGHLHHFAVTEVGDNKFEIYMGTLQGTNNYAKKCKFNSSAGQGIIIIHEDGEIEPKNIRLQVS